VVAGLTAFRDRHRLDRVVAVNVSSTEPVPDPHPAHTALDALTSALREPGRPVGVNRALRAKGLLRVYTQAGMEYRRPCGRPQGLHRPAGRGARPGRCRESRARARPRTLR
jgi:hypothetical protein